LLAPGRRIAVRAQRAFPARLVHFLVTEAGIRQFLDIGTGLPSANNTHQCDGTIKYSEIVGFGSSA
jgi:hypothetical protein